MDEVSVAEKLESFRKEQEGYIEPSFGTISAYGPNAAMCHYQATKEDFSVLQPKGMYLVDSGGQYYEGTTDITRTIVVGPLTEEEKEHFTITAMGTLRLETQNFSMDASASISITSQDRHSGREVLISITEPATASAIS